MDDLFLLHLLMQPFTCISMDSGMLTLYLGNYPVLFYCSSCYGFGLWEILCCLYLTYSCPCGTFCFVLFCFFFPLQSVISPRIPSSFYWRMTLELIPWALGVIFFCLIYSLFPLSSFLLSIRLGFFVVVVKPGLNSEALNHRAISLAPFYFLF